MNKFRRLCETSDLEGVKKEISTLSHETNPKTISEYFVELVYAVHTHEIDLL